MKANKQTAKKATGGGRTVKDGDAHTGTAFHPTEAQERVLAHLQNADYACTVIDACAACDVGRRTFYNWFDNPRFARWWREQAERWAALQAGRVYGALLRSAAGEDVGGSAADRKTYLERFDEGYAPRQKREISGAVTFGEWMNSLTDRCDQDEPAGDES